MPWDLKGKRTSSHGEVVNKQNQWIKEVRTHLIFRAEGIDLNHSPAVLFKDLSRVRPIIMLLNMVSNKNKRWVKVGQTSYPSFIHINKIICR